MNKGTIIIPAAGLGTRFLPFTKAIPKEMVPLLNKPAIHYIIDEGKKADFDHFAFVISPTKQSLKDYFSKNSSLDDFLDARNKSHLAVSIQELMENIYFDWFTQNEPKGLGDALSCAQSAISDDFFAVCLPDDILINGHSELNNMRQLAHEYNASIIAVQEIPKKSISAYGVIKPDKIIDERHCTISHVVEKPNENQAPSSLAILGRYVFSRDIFNYLEGLKPGANGEIQLTDAITSMIQDGYPFISHTISARRFDIGTPTGWLEANNYLNNLI